MNKQEKEVVGILRTHWRAAQASRGRGARIGGSRSISKKNCGEEITYKYVESCGGLGRNVIREQEV